MHTVRTGTPAGGRAEERHGRPRLLFLCQTLPFPPDGGVEIRTYNILRLLARSFDVTALCFYRQATRPTAAAVANGVGGMSDLAQVAAFPVPHEQSRVRLAWDHLRSVVTQRAYTHYTYESSDFRQALRSLLSRERFDLAHVDSLDLSTYMSELRGLPVILTHQNVESALLRRRSVTERSLAMRRYLNLQARLTEAEERRWSGRVAMNVVVSEDDAQALRALVPGAAVTVVPNGVDTDQFRPAAVPGDGGIVFVGGYNWHPNRDGMEYFAQEILPGIRREAPDVTVTWIGRAPPAVADEYRSAHGVQLTGYIEDIRSTVTSAACYVVPLRAGGGSRLKILDAWAMGMAVVSTAVGCEGLEARDGENILIRDTPADFAAGVLAVLRDADLRAQLGRGARRTAEQTYSWEILGDHLLKTYTAALRENASR